MRSRVVGQVFKASNQKRLPVPLFLLRGAKRESNQQVLPPCQIVAYKLLSGLCGSDAKRHPNLYDGGRPGAV